MEKERRVSSSKEAAHESTRRLEILDLKDVQTHQSFKFKAYPGGRKRVALEKGDLVKSVKTSDKRPAQACATGCARIHLP